MTTLQEASNVLYTGRAGLVHSNPHRRDPILPRRAWVSSPVLTAQDPTMLIGQPAQRVE